MSDRAAPDNPALTSPPATAAPWNAPQALRSNNIDFLRFFLAALVIFAHSYALPVGSDATEPLYVFSHGQRTFGHIAVDFFFILSGFLITHSWLRSKGLLDFLWRRALRIYPAFIVATLVGVFFFAPVFGGGGKAFISSIDPGKFILGLVTLDPGGFKGGFDQNPMPAINGSLWSIPFEAWCYVGVAALGLATILAKRPALMLLALVLAIAGSLIYEYRNLALGGGVLGQIVGSPKLWARLIPFFIAGQVFYLFRHRIPWHPALLAVAIAAMIAGCKVPHALSIISPIAGPYILFAIAFLPSIKLQHFGKFGDFSYGLYVYAFPIQQSLVAKFGTDFAVWKLFVSSFFLTLAFAVASWYLVESPFLKLKKLGKKSPPPAPTPAPPA
ncbi:MAG TPA: acyltransferase [Phycisphaerales bacterium]|nr:acyltransferase [Phycisphaerales bacterium]